MAQESQPTPLYEQLRTVRVELDVLASDLMSTNPPTFLDTANRVLNIRDMIEVAQDSVDGIVVRLMDDETE